MTKICRDCRKEKPLDEFYARSNGRSLTSKCKLCTSADAKKWRQRHMTAEHRRRWSVAVKAKRQRIKDAVFGAYGGYHCACCGETERSFLTIDHVANDGAKFRREVLGGRTAAGSQTYRWLVEHNFPAGYQVLCMNCQWGKRMNNGVCPHQARRNDHPLVGVGPSGPKRTASALKLVSDEDMVSSAAKVAAAR
jgi:hypothetical protein